MFVQGENVLAPSIQKSDKIYYLPAGPFQNSPIQTFHEEESKKTRVLPDRNYSPLNGKTSETFSYLDTRFRQVDLEGHFFSHEDVRIAGLGEQRFQHVQLATSERRPFSSLLPASSIAPWIKRNKQNFDVNPKWNRKSRLRSAEEVNSEKNWVIFTWSVHTWREPDGRMERVHGRRRHSQTGQTGHTTTAHLSVMMMKSNGTHADSHVHGVRVAFGQVGHDVCRIINFLVAWTTADETGVQSPGPVHSTHWSHE